MITLLELIGGFFLLKFFWEEWGVYIVSVMAFIICYKLFKALIKFVITDSLDDREKEKQVKYDIKLTGRLPE